MSLHFFAAHKVVTALSAAVLAASAWLGVLVAEHIPSALAVQQSSPTSQSPQTVLASQTATAIKEYIDLRFKALEDLRASENTADATALSLAAVTQKERDDKANHLQALLKEQATTFVTIADLKRVEAAISSMEKRNNITDGIIIALGVVFGVIKWLTSRRPPTARRETDIPKAVT